MTSHHRMMTMNRSSTGAGELETFAMANCLMLLNNQASCLSSNGGTDERRLFSCKTCGRRFSSFQALGGHRASHKKIKSSLYESKESNKSSISSEKPKTHVCTICGAEFPIGQALGGHMRRHRQTPVTGGGGSTVTTEASEISGGGDHHDSSDHKRKLDDEVTIVVVPNLKKSSSCKRVCLDNLDLNLYLWNHKSDENDRSGVDEGEVVEEVEEDKEFLKLELRQPIN